MGRQIVYCEACGNSLREDDFDKGKGRLLDNRPFCTECRPYKEGEVEFAPRRNTSSAKIPAPPPRKTSTGSIPIIPAPPRRPAAAPASNPLPIIAGVGAVALILIVVAVSQSSSPQRPSGPVVQDPPLVTTPPVRTPAEPPPPPPPKDPLPPPPPPRRDPPSNPTKNSDPLHVPTAAEKFEAFLAQIRNRIQEDVRKERSTEILNMFAAASKIAGPRAAEVAKLKAEYLDTVDEPTRRLALWAEWKITSSNEAGSTGLLDSHGDRTSVMMTHPADRTTPARLEREVDIPSGKKTTLSFSVACHQQGDFELRLFIDGKEALKEIVGPKGSGWRDKKVDLSLHAGKKVAIRLENAANNWEWEHAYWHDLKITYE
jgi:hypothetical protein